MTIKYKPRTLPPASADDILSTYDVMMILNISERTIHKLVRSGEIPMKKVGNQWRIRRGTLIAWIDQDTRPVRQIGTTHDE